jgi:hypothetical protein
LTEKLRSEGYLIRHSFCCSNCGRRVTPGSARFVGRKFYWSFFFILARFLKEHKVHYESVTKHCGFLAMHPKTLSRWSKWWKNELERSGNGYEYSNIREICIRFLAGYGFDKPVSTLIRHFMDKEKLHSDFESEQAGAFIETLKNLRYYIKPPI